MPLYRIQHGTTCRHDSPAAAAWQTLRLRPRDEPGQTVLDFDLDITPRATDLSSRRDAFGNHLHLFSVRETHSALSVSTTSLVRRDPPPPPASTPGLTLAQAAAATDAAILAGDFALEQFRHPTLHVPALPEIDDLVAPLRPDHDLHAALATLAARFRDDFTFDPRATHVETPLAEVLSRRRGVCQDFAHAYLAAARRLGLAAAYVSGYLRTTPPPGAPRLVGADAMHAWVSLWLPGHGWFDYDPTNHAPAGDGHLVVARGRDYADVSPARGVFTGGGRHTLYLGVTVEPVTPDVPEPTSE